MVVGRGAFSRLGVRHMRDEDDKHYVLYLALVVATVCIIIALLTAWLT
jgi:hypothetical protein